jgi:hypothetical protein
MKMNKWFIACLVCLLWSYQAGLVLAASAAGEVIALQGSAWTEQDGQRRALEVKAPVHAGESLVTGADSKMQVRFMDNTVLAIGPQASVKLDAFFFSEGEKGSIGLHFAKGLARVVSGKIVQQNPEGMRLSSPLAFLGIRGTTTIHDVAASKETHAVEFLTTGHSVVLTGLDGNSVAFDKPMTAVDVRAGQATPRAPRALTPAELNRVHLLTVANRFTELAAMGNIAVGESGFVQLNPQTEAACQGTREAVSDRQDASRHDQQAMAGHLGALISSANLASPDYVATLGGLVAAGQLTRETSDTLGQADAEASAQITALEEAAAYGGSGGGGGGGGSSGGSGDH